jgi:predicted DNA-binding transcriptional regulator AlpA
MSETFREREILKQALRPVVFELFKEWEAERQKRQPPARTRMLRAAEVAAELGIHVKEVYRRAESGEIPKVPNMGRRVRFDPDVIDRVRAEGLLGQE